MRRSKSLIIGLISLALIAVLVVILLLKDSSELVSIKQAQELIESNPPQKLFLIETTCILIYMTNDIGLIKNLFCQWWDI